MTLQILFPDFNYLFGIEHFFFITLCNSNKFLFKNIYTTAIDKMKDIF